MGKFVHCHLTIITRGIGMELKIKVDPEQVNNFIKGSLVEYHQYLYKAYWESEDEQRQKIRDAMLLVLEQYMDTSEYEKYVASLLN